MHQHLVSIQTTSTPLPPPPLNGYITIMGKFLFFFSDSVRFLELELIQKQPMGHLEQILLLLFVPSVVLLLKQIQHHQKQLHLHLPFHLQHQPLNNNLFNHNYRFHLQLITNLNVVFLVFTLYNQYHLRQIIIHIILLFQLRPNHHHRLVYTVHSDK
jgi:hypothetical protein